jgi:hypothetical protein
LAELLAADLSGLDLVALMVDGVHFAEHCCVVALGIDIDGVKHPLSLVEGSTENATLVTELLVGLRERGLNVTRPILVVIDGSKALRRAVVDVFDHPVIQRCQLHKRQKCGGSATEDAALGGGQADAGGLPRRHRAGRPGVVGIPGQRARPNPSNRGDILARGSDRHADRAAPGSAAHPGSDLAQHQLRRKHDRICRDHARNVKRWRNGQMALRWCAAGMVEAGTQFRRVNGHLHLRTLRTALQRQISADNAAATKHNHTSSVA